MYAVTGASGRLGRLVVDSLLEKISPNQIVALTRQPIKLADIAEKGVTVRPFDFDDKENLLSGLEGIERLLLISGPDIGQRERQHSAAIQAAKERGVKFIAYTSVLHADTCPLNLASEHRATEKNLKESGLNYALLRHGWYTENTTMNATKEIARGTVNGSAGNGRQSTATRADFAAGDAAVLLDRSIVNQTIEFAGDEGYTMSEYAAVLSELSGTSITYVNMPGSEYREVLERDGLPRHVATLLAHASATSADSVMFDDGCALSKFLGHPTTSLRSSVEQALSGSRAKDAYVFSHSH